MRREHDVSASGITITGDKALAKLLDALGSEASINRVVRPGVRAGMSPVSKAAKKNARAAKDTGALAKSVGISKGKKRTGDISFRVSARRGMKYAVPDPVQAGRMRIPFFYAHLVELGTRKMAARPFLGPAWQAHKANAFNILAGKIRENIPKELAKLRAKGKR